MRIGSRAIRLGVASLPTFVFFWSLFLPTGFVLAAPAGTDFCIGCHSNPNFLVTNKKLYDYYRNWQQSIHGQEGVTCSDCHEGHPDKPTKDAAHGGTRMSATHPDSPVSYRNIPATCSQCHQEHYEKYRTSSHFKHFRNTKGGRRGPNCVTCHGSVDTTVLDINTVQKACEQCHNKKTGNHPAIPAKAKTLLTKFLSIHRFYRYFLRNRSLFPDQEAFDFIDRKTEELFIGWHSFDLPAIEKNTTALLYFLQTTRNEILEKKSKNP